MISYTSGMKTYRISSAHETTISLSIRGYSYRSWADIHKLVSSQIQAGLDPDFVGNLSIHYVESRRRRHISEAVLCLMSDAIGSYLRVILTQGSSIGNISFQDETGMSPMPLGSNYPDREELSPRVSTVTPD